MTAAAASSSSSDLSAAQIAAAKPDYVPFDHSLPGRFVGLMAMLGSWSTNVAKELMDKTKSQLAWTKDFGELQGYMAELKGLFAGKTTMKLSELKGDAKARGVELMRLINGKLADVGIAERLDANGQVIPPTTELPEEPALLFGTKTRVAQACADPAAAEAADRAAKAAAEARVQRYLSIDPQSKATSSSIQLGQRSLVRVVNALELMGVDITTSHGDLDPKNAQVGADLASRNFNEILSGFRANEAKLTGSSDEKLRTAANNFKTWLDDAYQAEYKPPALLNVRNGLIESDDLAAIEGAAVRIQTYADTLSQEVNKSVQASSVEVQKSNGWFDASKGGMDLMGRMNRAYLNY